MDKKELEKINTLFAFLNDLSSQFAKKMKETDKDQNKAVVSELYEMVEDLKNTIKEKGPDLPFQQNISANYPFWLSQFKHYKLEVQPKIELPEFPKFPSKISVEEAADITDILLRIVEEVKKKDFKIDLGAVEDGLWGLQTRLAKEIDGLKKTLPKIPKIELPMEKGRIKVILPEDQVIRTPLGERISKVVRGVFLGGETINPIVAVRRTDGQQINPATEEKQQQILEAVAQTPTIYNVDMTTANTEYSQALPANTRKLDIKLRVQNALLKIAFVEGESGTNYIQISYGSSLHLENVKLNNIIVYFQSPSNSQVCEILAWT